MSQITWRNVDAPDFSGALKGVEVANKLFNQALESAGSGVNLYRGMQRDAADRAIALRASEIQDPAAYRQALIDRSLIGLDGNNASVDTIQKLGAGVNTLAERDMVQNKAVDQLHASANALRSEQDRKLVSQTLFDIKNTKGTAPEAFAAYREISKDWTPEQKAMLQGSLEQLYGVPYGGPLAGGSVSGVGGVPAVAGSAAAVPSGSATLTPNGTPVSPADAATARLTAAGGVPPGTVESTLLTSSGALAEEATIRANEDIAAAGFDYPALMSDKRSLEDIKKGLDPASTWAGADPQQFEGNFAAVKQKMVAAGIKEPSDAAVFAVMNKSLTVGGLGRDFFESFKQAGNETDPAFNGWYLDPDVVDTNISKLTDNTSRNKQATAKETLAQVDLLKQAQAQKDAATQEVLMWQQRVAVNPDMAPSLAVAEQRLAVHSQNLNDLTQQLKDRENTRTTEAVQRTQEENITATSGLGSNASGYSDTFNKKWAETASPTGRKQVYGYKREIKNGQLIESGRVLTGGGKSEVITTTSPAPVEKTPAQKVTGAIERTLTPEQQRAADNDPARRLLTKAANFKPVPPEDQRQVWTRDDLDAIIQDEAQQAGLPKDVVDKFVKIESSYDPYAVSKAGAMGLFQVLPEGALAEGKRLGVINDSFDPYDPQQNARLAFWYIKQLSKQYGGDMRKTVAAYNTGPGNLQKAVAKAKTSGKSWEDHLAGETKDYLKKFFG